MKGRLWNLVCRLRVNPRHPSFEQLVDWQAGELEDRWLTWTSKHVLACPRCRWEAGVIREVLSRSSAAEAKSTSVPSMENGVEGLLSLLKDEAAVKAARQRFREHEDLQFAARLRPYLGSCPLALLDNSIRAGVPFNTEAMRMAEMLLGRKAAAALSDFKDLEAGLS